MDNWYNPNFIILLIFQCFHSTQLKNGILKAPKKNSFPAFAVWTLMIDNFIHNLKKSTIVLLLEPWCLDFKKKLFHLNTQLPSSVKMTNHIHPLETLFIQLPVLCWSSIFSRSRSITIDFDQFRSISITLDWWDRDRIVDPIFWWDRDRYDRDP